MPQRRLVFIVLNISITVVFAKSISSSPEERAFLKQKRLCGDNFKLSTECEDECRRRSLFQLCLRDNETCLCDFPKDSYDDTSKTEMVDLNMLRKHEPSQESTADNDSTHAMTVFIGQRTNSSSEPEANQKSEADRTVLRTAEPKKVDDHKKKDTAIIHATDVEPITAGKTKANGTSDEKKDADKRPDSIINEKPMPKDGASVIPRVEDESKDKATNPIAEGATKVHAEKQDAAELPAKVIVKAHVEEGIKGSVIKHDSKDTSTEAVHTLDHHVALKDGPEAPIKKQQDVVHAETHLENQKNTKVPKVGNKRTMVYSNKNGGGFVDVESSAEYSSKPESSSTQGAKLPVVSGKVSPHVQSLEKPSSESSQPSLPVSSSAHTISSATVNSDSLSNISSDEVPHAPHSSEELIGVEAVAPFEDDFVAPARAFKSAINDKSMLSALISQTFIMSAVIVYVALCAIFMYMRSYRKRKYDRVPLLENFSD